MQIADDPASSRHIVAPLGGTMTDPSHCRYMARGFLARLARTTSVETLQAQEHRGTLRRALGARDLIAIGLGTILYRKDRIKYSKGAELLKGYKIEENSTTSRVVATCCNSAMVMRFNDAKHSVPVYRARFQGDMPPLQWRICTKFKPENAGVPMDIPSSMMYPAGFMWKLLTSKLSMLFSR